jgi:OOP family OmpA-OmpF porin
MKGIPMNKKWLVAMLGAAAMSVSAGAMAQQQTSGWYVGGDIGNADFGTEDDTAFRVLGGYQFNRNLAAEVGYGMLFDKGGVDVTSLDVVGVGSFPLGNKFSLFGKLGIAMWEVDAGPFGSEDGNDLTYAIGLQYDISRNLALRGQWQSYDTDPEEVDVLTIGFIYRF